MTTAIVQPYLESEKIKIGNMKSFFDNGNTLDIKQRKILLKKLEQSIEKRTQDICDAIYKDFHKPQGEMLLTEILTTLAELRHTISNLEKWTRPQSVSTNILVMPASSKLYKSPKGIVLIFAPWNYPFYLAMMPFISAIAAGNVVVLKPASETMHMSLLIKEIVAEVFDEKHAFVILGEGRPTGELLLDNFVFNHIFFTGSAKVGKWIMEKAAPNLTPVTLELGGKSPAIIGKGYDLDRAAKKIVWGKFINAGQTCVCTDYVLLHSSQMEEFVNLCKKHIIALFGDNVFESPDYSYMINHTRYNRVLELMQQGKILFGGKTDENKRCIEPTLIQPNSLDEAIMNEEIFGPVLPIITYDTKEQVVDIVRRNRYPLALYMFSDDKSFAKYIYDKIEFGGGCENTTVFHLGNPHLPFGGIQNSGMGSYHGKHGIDTFSNVKPILNTAKWFDMALLYQPYTSNKIKILKQLFKM